MYYLLPFLLFLGLSIQAIAQSSYKEMMTDPSFNFYDVIEAAETYFETHEKGKGSGYKGYQRWKAENEGKYFPSGNRSNVDPFLVKKAYQKILRDNEAQKSSFSNGWRDLGPYDANTSEYFPNYASTPPYAGRIQT